MDSGKSEKKGWDGNQHTTKVKKKKALEYVGYINSRLTPDHINEKLRNIYSYILSANMKVAFAYINEDMIENNDIY